MASYAVTLRAYMTVWVENVEHEDEAMDIAWENCDKSKFELDDAVTENKFKKEDCDQIIK